MRVSGYACVVHGLRGNLSGAFETSRVMTQATPLAAPSPPHSGSTVASQHSSSHVPTADREVSELCQLLQCSVVFGAYRYKKNAHSFLAAEGCSQNDLRSPPV